MIAISPHIIHRVLNLFETEDNWADKEDYFLNDVLYLSIFIENFVLHDQVLTIDYLDIDFDEDAAVRFDDDRFNKPDIEKSYKKRIRKNIILNDLYKSNDIIIREYYPDAAFYRSYKSRVELGLDPTEVYLSEDHSIIKEFLKLGLSFVPDFTKSMNSAISLIDKFNVENITRLTKAYFNLSGDLKKELSILASQGNNIQIFIPPISSIIFARSKNIGEVAKHTIEVKEEFAELRKNFDSYEKKITDSSLSLKESLEAHYELESSINLLFKKKSDSIPRTIVEWKDISTSIKFIDGISASDISSLSNIMLGAPLKVLGNRIKKRKARYLFQLQDDFLNINNYGRLIQNLFKKEITDKHIRIIKAQGFQKNTF